MRILLVSHELGGSGAPRALLNLAKVLKDLNHSVELISPIDGDIKGEFQELGVDIIINPTIFVKNASGFDFISQYDLVFFNTIVSLAFAENIKNIQTRKICWVHEGSFAYELFSNRAWLYGRNDIYNFHELFQNVDEIYCVSSYSKDIARKYTDKEIKILPYYIPDLFNTYNYENTKCGFDDELVIGMYGTVERRKGICLLDEAFKLLPFNIKKNIKIQICGGLTSDAVSNSSFNYLGKMSHDILLKSYNKIDLLICPSLDDPLPITVCEALMMNCPVAVSNHTGFYTLVYDNQYTFQCDKDDLANCIKEIYKSKKNLPKIGEKGREIYLRYFTEDKFKNNIENILKSEQGSF